MGFKMKPPYKLDPTPVYEVPFDNPDLVAKANKNGTTAIHCAAGSSAGGSRWTSPR